MTRRRAILSLGVGMVAALASRSRGEVPARRPVVGILHSESASRVSSRIDEFRRGLEELGYVEGANVGFEFRWAEGDDARLPALASELVALKVDVIVTTATEPVLAVERATATIPIVFATVGDAVATGVVLSLSHPGRNATGSTFFSPELMAKRLELAMQAMPRIKRVGALLHPDSPLNEPILHAMNASGMTLGSTVRAFNARDLVEVKNAFTAMTREQIDAVVVHDHPRFIGTRNEIADFAKRRRIALIGYDELAEAGGLIGYGANFGELWHRAAYFVAKILKGTPPSNIPVEQATKFDLVINVATAGALGLTIPNTLLVRADRVIR